jgi:hypothetical protein
MITKDKKKHTYGPRDVVNVSWALSQCSWAIVVLLSLGLGTGNPQVQNSYTAHIPATTGTRCYDFDNCCVIVTVTCSVPFQSWYDQVESSRIAKSS